MNIVVTGGAGFLGQALIRRLVEDGSIALDGQRIAFERIVCFDTTHGALADPRVANVAGTITDIAQVESLIDASVRVVFHLASVVSGGAEQDFDLGMRVNLDGTRHLLEACRHHGARPRLLFSSSIAVFGGDLPAVVTDGTPTMPQSSYGTQKRACELLLQDYARKGFLDGRSVRVPTVVVRPGAPNAAASGFASGIIREPLAGVETVLPVSPDTRMWIASPRAVIEMFLQAVDLPEAAWGWNRSLNLPGLTATMAEELDALRRVAGEAVAARVRHEPDQSIMRLVRTWAGNFDTARALAMGFTADRDFEAIVRAYIEDHPEAVRI
ncbi:MAG: NAD-dependent epimerase/dehydratase family protein [Burkholderiales bacterium]|nr:MAG: NAD-dependent epimerase/dehydratase family protein [Burkholderiales bacterium]